MTGPGARRAAAQVARPAPSCSASPILLACLWALGEGWGATFWSWLNPCDFSRPVSFSTSPACRAKTFPGDPSPHNLYPNPHAPPPRSLSSRCASFWQEATCSLGPPLRCGSVFQFPGEVLARRVQGSGTCSTGLSEPYGAQRVALQPWAWCPVVSLPNTPPLTLRRQVDESKGKEEGWKPTNPSN